MDKLSGACEGTDHRPGTNSPAPSPPTPAVCHSVVLQGSRHGRGVFAARDLEPGELVIFEAPLAVARAGEDVSAWPEGNDVDWEWRVTRELLVSGHRREWAAAYARDGVAGDLEGGCEHPNIQHLLGIHAAPSHAPLQAEDILEVYRAVANNSFLLETTMCRVIYGAGFFSYSSYINHSCAPNCLSLKLGGNMAVFAARCIPKGQELFHHYVPLTALLGNAEGRAGHLYFDCKCERCSGEDDAAAAALQALEFPSRHYQTEAGKVWRRDLLSFLLPLSWHCRLARQSAHPRVCPLIRHHVFPVPRLSVLLFWQLQPARETAT